MGSLISLNAFAHNIQPNQLLANVTVSDKGEITLNGNDVAYKSWSSSGNHTISSAFFATRCIGARAFNRSSGVSAFS
ncbi:MAG: YtfJ family protein [Haemophilus parainfluenzae]|nr:YtfJ family protein [Haemophilus parainfluenzae]